jgi:hypothetical protein
VGLGSGSGVQQKEALGCRGRCIVAGYARRGLPVLVSQLGVAAGLNFRSQGQSESRQHGQAGRLACLHICVSDATYSRHHHNHNHQTAQVKKTAVSPDALPSQIFSGVGRCHWYDQVRKIFNYVSAIFIRVFVYLFIYLSIYLFIFLNNKYRIHYTKIGDESFASTPHPPSPRSRPTDRPSNHP